MVPLKYRWDSEKVLFVSESATTIKEAVAEAVAKKAYLGGADLGGADLGGADLGGAYLGRAYLRGAYLRGADLRGAYLGGAYLRGAKINWQSHDAEAEILQREAGRDIEKQKIAGLILISRDRCWHNFLAMDDQLKDWALDTLAAYCVDGDGAPEAIASRRKKDEKAEAGGAGAA